MQPGPDFQDAMRRKKRQARGCRLVFIPANTRGARAAMHGSIAVSKLK